MEALVSLILVSLLAGAGAASVGLWLRQRRRRRAESATRRPEVDTTRVAGLEIGVGDVVSIHGQELWLEQGWLLSESGRPLAALFEAREDSVLQFAPPRREQFRLTRVEFPFPADAPTSVEHDGERYERVRRLPVELSGIGESRPPPWQAALLLEYRSLGGELLLVLGQAPHFLCWFGPSLPDGAIERWGSA
jgi:hypothetical protein